MRAVAIDRFGSPEEMHVVDLPVAEPGPGEVRVRVTAAGVNPLDYKIRDGSSGLVKDFGPDDFPLVLGRECCGVVEAAGEGSGLAVGTRVFGMAPLRHRGGCYAEQVVLPADCLSPAPEGAEDHRLAGTALAGLTAWTAVHDLAKVSAGETVLVHGGAGGVGQFVVQLAVEAGATVYATASAGKRELVESMGAVHVDYTREDFTTATPRPEVIVDGVYFGTYGPSMDHLKDGGRLVILPSLADLGPARERGIEVSVPLIAPDPSRLAALAERVADGRLTVEVGQVLPLSEAAHAHRLVEGGHARGKVVLEVTR
ncbi:NADP-dependent oxidoreductase [Austwickia chelonae]|uniref:NADP-dependent oxidoreductase n=1 Tax=Austwickia chelonae TaxID=100225 RepID=UPI000E254277|nr:NADP-dependent oxidoreductase [Austwickia chelonae]